MLAEDIKQLEDRSKAQCSPCLKSFSQCQVLRLPNSTYIVYQMFTHLQPMCAAAGGMRLTFIQFSADISGASGRQVLVAACSAGRGLVLHCGCWML
jgi:hypothetical protein